MQRCEGQGQGPQPQPQHVQCPVSRLGTKFRVSTTDYSRVEGTILTFNVGLYGLYAAISAAI